MNKQNNNQKVKWYCELRAYYNICNICNICNILLSRIDTSSSLKDVTTDIIHTKEMNALCRWNVVFAEVAAVAVAAPVVASAANPR